MNTSAVRVVIDTNIIIAMISKKSPFRWIFDAIIEGSLILCVTNEIILEYQEILAKKNGEVVAENIINFLSVHPYVEKFDIFYKFRLIDEDPDDNKFVDCAIASDAHYLVSNDKHFQILKTINFPKVNFLSLQEFEEKIKEDI